MQEVDGCEKNATRSHQFFSCLSEPIGVSSEFHFESKSLVQS